MSVQSFAFATLERMLQSFISYSVSVVISLLINSADLPVSFSATRVRPLSTVLERALLDGYAQSPTMRCLVDALEDSNVIVHVVAGRASDGSAGRLIFVTAAGGQRILRVVIDPAMPPLVRMATLGHELQHVLEVASAPWVIDPDSFAALFHDIGYPAVGTINSRRYETAAAKRVGAGVLADLLVRDRKAYAVESRVPTPQSAAALSRHRCDLEYTERRSTHHD